MKIVDAGYTLIQEPSISKKIEQIARLCYKSEDKIKEGSDLKMINTLVKHQHTAMLEHGSMAFMVDHYTYALVHEAIDMAKSYIYDDVVVSRDYLRFSIHLNPSASQSDEEGTITTEYTPDRYIISGNMRAWINALDILVKNSCLPEALCKAAVDNSCGILESFRDKGCVEDSYVVKDHPFTAVFVSDYEILTHGERMLHEDVSVLFTVDRGVTHEMVRHRDCSFAQESTRYVNYSDGKYGSEICVVKPCFWPEDSALYKQWAAGCQEAETGYMSLIELGASPQQARDVLPTSTKAEIVMTCNLREWNHILNLRACNVTGKAHPQIVEVMLPLAKEFRDGKYSFAVKNLVIPE